MNDNNGNIDDLFNEIAGSTIKKYREYHRMSLEEVVRKMKTAITRQSLYKYENNLARLKTNIFIDICNALGEDPEIIYREISNTLEYALDNKILAKDKITIRDYTEDFYSERQINYKKANNFDEFEIMFDKYKDILTDDDKEYIKFIFEKRKKELENKKKNQED